MTETKLLPLLTWRQAVARSSLPATSKLVALALSLYMNEMGGSAFPGVALLMSNTSLSERAVRGHLKNLVDEGWLVLVERGGTKGDRKKANAYQAVIPNPCTSFHSEDAPPLHDVPTTPAPPAADPCTTFTPSLHELSSISGLMTKDDSYSADGGSTTGFDDWWSGYPRKVNKAQARKSYQARRREGIDHDRLVSARDSYAEARRGKDPNFTMHGSKFLSAKDGPWSEWEFGPPEVADFAHTIVTTTEPEPRLVLPPSRVETCPECESSMLACVCRRN